ncbi:hypothetical protein [Arcobacter vandammei]|uniref:hypothetical protein n=1 Tax=Arcobacter vandammei TaxID=2782243 RepID=UPI0018DF7363|nr:hypothetical protein [Arcobacter vandammei]
MRRKIKSFFEDFIIVVILIAVIYGSYSYFFDDSMDNFEATTQTMVQTAEEPKEEIKELTQDEAIKDVITDEHPDIETENRTPPALVQSSLENSKEEPKTDNKEELTDNKEELTENKVEKIIEEKIENTTLQRKINLVESSKLEKSASIEEQIEKEKFYKSLKDKIQLNIEKNFDISSINEPVFADIRVTILKDGRYEQLVMTNGNSEFFNKIKSSISNSFPIEINNNLKNIFPRYYRLKIEFN